MTSKSLWAIIFAVFFNSFVTSVSADTGSKEYCSKTLGLTKVERDGPGGISNFLLQGNQGEPGLKGDQGPAGIPGTPGTCGCVELTKKVRAGRPRDWGKEDNVASKTCRNAPDGVNGIRHIYLDNPMKIECDSITKKTCLIITTKTEKLPYTETNPFWLSEKLKPFSLKNIYGLEFDQLLWLQRESYSASLTIRYHCKNSNPVGEHAMALLTWNDMIVGPTTTESAPFKYSVQNDGCSNATKDTWSFTDIVIVSPFVHRLPIIDFFIKDVRNGNQELQIEILELCFG